MKVDLAIFDTNQWSRGVVSCFHAPGSGFYPRAGQGRLNLSSLQWVDKGEISLLGDFCSCTLAPMVSYTEMDTLGLSPNVLLTH
ncbi:hypothetical protein TNCV_4707871 [Trichonephila clavipes]|nr:hypothetical protein TNCV_4707871 [Trichonephila clavipes]